MKNCIYRASANRMSSGQNPYYNGYHSYDFPKKFPLIQPLTEVKRNTYKNKSLEKSVFEENQLWTNSVL